MMMCLQVKESRPARSPRPGKPIFVFLALLVATCSASAGTRLFLPVFSEPVPAQIERELRILSAGSGGSLGTLLAGRSMTATAMDSGGGRLFIGGNSSPGGLSVYDIGTGTLRTLDIPVSFPNAFGLDESSGRLFVGGFVDDNIAEIDLVSMQVVNVIELTGQPVGVEGIAVDPNRGRLHLIRQNRLETIDLATSAVIQRVDLEPMSAVRDMQRFDALRDRLYFSAGLSQIEVFDVTDEGLVPYATVQFDRQFRSLFLDAPGARLYGGVTSAGIDEGTYAIDVDSIPPGASSSDAVDTRFLSLPRRAPYMDLDRDSGILYLVQDYHVTPPLPPRPPGDPMTIFAVDPQSLEIQQIIETEIGGPSVPIDGFLTRIDGPNGVAAASVPALTGPGVFLLLAVLGTVGFVAMRKY